MITVHSTNFEDAIIKAGSKLFDYGQVIYTDKWQGIEMKETQRFFEMLNISLVCGMNLTGAYSSKHLPNWEWANLHFKERVSGIPLNPGESYKIWPFYGRDKEVRNEVFSHTYMERYWPKFANVPLMNKGDVPAVPQSLFKNPIRGIRYQYGDLQDLINHLINEPFSRQAYLPVFFPEDTGAIHGGRIPCSIGYHFIIRDKRLHCVYQLRSCDYFRHLPDDLYLTILLAQHIAKEFNKKSKLDYEIELGVLTTHITSLHIFEQEKPRLKNLIG